jgi:hypothetical protein
MNKKKIGNKKKINNEKRKSNLKYAQSIVGSVQAKNFMLFNLIILFLLIEIKKMQLITA